MKISDDYKAKQRLWIAASQVAPLPKGPPLPPFGSRRFRSHEEMNRWKKELLAQCAREARPHG